MSVLLVPATRENLASTIEKAVPPSRLEPYVPAGTLSEIQSRGGTEGIRCWAMTTTLRTRFNAMQQGDIVLLSEKATGRFNYFARVTFKIENRALGDALWSFKGDKAWELIYFLHDIQRINIPKTELVTKLGYDVNFAVPGPTLVQDAQVQGFEDVNGSLLEWLGVSYVHAEPPPVQLSTAEVDTTDYSGASVIAETKRRIGQEVFARKVKANYGMACAMCGISEEAFLVAGHIRPWSKDVLNRLNPANGICLCVLHDRAFEAGYLVIDEDLHIRLTRLTVLDSPLGQQLKSVAGQRLRRPAAAPPAFDLLKWHRDKYS